MPKTSLVTGSFARNGVPVRGPVTFTPCRLWVLQDGVHWACLAPRLWLDAEGSFTAFLTATNTDSVSWCYLVDTPAGRFSIQVPYSEVGYSLKELIDESHPGSRAQDGR